MKPEGLGLHPAACESVRLYIPTLSQGNITSVRKLSRHLLPNFQNKTIPLNFYKYVYKKLPNSPIILICPREKSQGLGVHPTVRAPGVSH